MTIVIWPRNTMAPPYYGAIILCRTIHCLLGCHCVDLNITLFFHPKQEPNAHEDFFKTKLPTAQPTDRPAGGVEAVIPGIPWYSKWPDNLINSVYFVISLDVGVWFFLVTSALSSFKFCACAFISQMATKVQLGSLAAWRDRLVARRSRRRSAWSCSTAAG